MLSRKTWYTLAVITAVFGVWLAFQPQSIVYSERELDGVLYQSKVDCGVGVSMVFAGRFDESVPGAATRADCLKYARTRVAELMGLAALTVTFVYVGSRFGREPPRSIRSELPDLPSGKPGFDGRPERPSARG